jgi:hypothetical protein
MAFALKTSKGWVKYTIGMTHRGIPLTDKETEAKRYTRRKDAEYKARDCACATKPSKYGGFVFEERYGPLDFEVVEIN